MNNPLVRTVLFFFVTMLLVLAGILMVIFFQLPDVRVWRSQNPRQTAFMKYRGEQHAGDTGFHASKIRWLPGKEIPPLFKKTVVVAEDASFWVHHGIDWYEMRKSLLKDFHQRRLSRGGSTITQQLAKNLYLSPHKSILRKIREAFIAMRLEKALSKNRILELYLNVIEFGPGLYGAETASQYYFRKPLGDLTLDEMIRLTAIIPSPLKLNPNRPSAALSWRANVILERLHFYRMVPDEAYFSAKNELDYFFGRKKRPYRIYFVG